MAISQHFFSKPFFEGKAAHLFCMPLFLTIVCLLLSYMYECSLVNLLMEETKIKKLPLIFKTN